MSREFVSFILLNNCGITENVSRYLFEKFVDDCSTYYKPRALVINLKLQVM